MEDKSYLEALMNAPSRDEQDTSFQQAAQSDEVSEKIKQFRERMAYLSKLWKQVNQRLYYARRHGTARQKRSAWKTLHRLHLYRRRNHHCG